jgi:hypothetical protein
MCCVFVFLTLQFGLGIRSTLVLILVKKFYRLGCFDVCDTYNSLERPLTRKQAFLLITFDGIGFILIVTIAPIAYFGSWAFVVSIIAIRFMVDQHPFFLEALTLIDNNIFPF